MKKIFAVTLALALFAGISTVSFAQDAKKEAPKTEQKAAKKGHHHHKGNKDAKKAETPAPAAK